MTARTLTRTIGRRNNQTRAHRTPVVVVPARSDQQLWKTDKAKAFEAGVQWFLAVSRTS